MKYRAAVTDRETAAVKGIRNGAIYPLGCDLPFVDLEWASFTVTDEAHNAYLPGEVRDAIARAVGVTYRTKGCVDYLAQAEEALAAIPKPPASPLMDMLDCHGAYCSELEDAALRFDVPAAWLEARTARPLDPTAPRLCDGGSEARRLAQLEADTKAAIAADTKRNAAAVAADMRPVTGALPAGIYAVARELPADGSKLGGASPHYVDPFDTVWTFHRSPAGIPNWLKSKPGREIRMEYPEGMTSAQWRSISPLEMTTLEWTENRRALKRRPVSTAPRPSPTLKYLELAKDLLAEYSRHLTSVYGGWAHLYVCEALVRGLCLPVGTAIDLIDGAVLEACGGKRVYGDFSLARAEVETLCVRAFTSQAPEAMEWAALVPAGFVDRVADRAQSFFETIKKFLTGKERATTPQIIEALAAAGAEPDESNPMEHRAILKATADLGFEKRRIQTNGQREMAFVKAGTPEPTLPPLNEGQQIRFYRSIKEFPDQTPSGPTDT